MLNEGYFMVHQNESLFTYTTDVGGLAWLEPGASMNEGPIVTYQYHDIQKHQFRSPSNPSEQRCA